MSKHIWRQDNEDPKIVCDNQGIPLCVCGKSQDARWVTIRLNLAKDLEQLTYDFAIGRTNGDDIVDYVFNDN